MKTGYSPLILWVLRLVPALLLLQTLYFKFSAAPESVYIFSTIGIEPWGRIGTGILQLVSAVLLLWPRFSAWGAALGTGLMGGALFFHATVLGIAVQNDGGLLFGYALLVFAACVIFLCLEKNNHPLAVFFRRFSGTKSV